MTDKAAGVVLWVFTAMNQSRWPGIRPMCRRFESRIRIWELRGVLNLCRTKSQEVALENGRKPMSHSIAETSSAYQFLN